MSQRQQQIEDSTGDGDLSNHTDGAASGCSDGLLSDSQQQRVERLIAKQLAYLKSWEPPLNLDPAARYLPLRGKLICTYGLMWTCLALMIASCIVGGGITTLSMNPMLGPPVDALITMGALRTPLIRTGEWWRLLWAPFLHAGWFHILMNFILWWKLGEIVEPDWGFCRTAFVFMISAVSGNLVSSTLDTFNVSVGASGGIFGIMGGCLPYVVEYWHTIPQPKCILWVVVFSLIVGLACGFMPGVDNYAHMGGAVGGIFGGFLTITKIQMGTSSPKNVSNRRRGLSIRAQMSRQLKRAGGTKTSQASTSLNKASRTMEEHSVSGEAVDDKGSNKPGLMRTTSLSSSKGWNEDKEREFDRRTSGSISLSGYGDVEDAATTKSERCQFYAEGSHAMAPPSVDRLSSVTSNLSDDDSDGINADDCSLQVMGDQTAKNHAKRQQEMLMSTRYNSNNAESSNAPHTSNSMESLLKPSNDETQIRRCSSDIGSIVNSKSFVSGQESSSGNVESLGRHRLAAASLTRHDRWRKAEELKNQSSHQIDSSAQRYLDNESFNMSEVPLSSDSFQQVSNARRQLRSDPVIAAEPSDMITKLEDGNEPTIDHMTELQYKSNAIDTSSTSNCQIPHSALRRSSVESRSGRQQSVGFASPVLRLSDTNKSNDDGKVEGQNDSLNWMQRCWRVVTNRNKVPPHRRMVRRAGIRATEVEHVDDSFSWKSKKAWFARCLGLIGFIGLWGPLLYLLFICPECYTAPGQVINIGKQQHEDSPPVVVFNAPPADTPLSDSPTRILYGLYDEAFNHPNQQLVEGNDLPVPPLSLSDEISFNGSERKVIATAEASIRAALDDLVAENISSDASDKVEYLFTWIRTKNVDVENTKRLQIRV